MFDMILAAAAAPAPTQQDQKVRAAPGTASAPQSGMAPGQAPDPAAMVATSFRSRAANKTPVPKQTYITKVGDPICGFGYDHFNNQ